MNSRLLRNSLFALMLSVVSVVSALGQQAKYIFYFIGDGMGQNEVLAAEMYMAEVEGEIGYRPLCMTQMPYSGSARNYSVSNSITCSAAAGTCLASGVKTKNGLLGIDAEGKAVETIAEYLKKEGWAVGITSSVSIDHATPASFYAHVSDRDAYYEIGRQLTASDFDFFAGAAFCKPIDKQHRTAPSLYRLLRENDYTLARGYGEYQNKKDGAKKMVLVQAHEAQNDSARGVSMLPYAIDRTAESLTLPQITEAAIDFLEDKGRFFLMVEGGAIDWANHGNDGATMVKEVIDFDRAIRVAYEFYLQHPDETLIVVTADHETGGLALGNSDYTLNLKLLQYQRRSLYQISDRLQQLHRQYGSSITWAQVRSVLETELGFYKEVEITDEEDDMLQDYFEDMQENRDKGVRTLYKTFDALSNAAVGLLNKKAKLGWTTHSHSAAAVPVFAVGVGAEQFGGWQDNKDIAPKMKRIALPAVR